MNRPSANRRLSVGIGGPSRSWDLDYQRLRDENPYAGPASIGSIGIGPGGINSLPGPVLPDPIPTPGPVLPNPIPTPGPGGQIRISDFSGVNHLGQKYGILVRDRFPAEEFTDSRLWNDLLRAVHDLGLVVVITDARRAPGGRGAKNSRHHTGRALDIAMVYPAGTPPQKATPQNKYAVDLFKYLWRNLGYRPGGDNPRPGGKGIIFGRVGSDWNQTDFDHSDHIHMSIK